MEAAGVERELGVMWFLYILRCADDSLYVGEAGDLESRLTKHNEGSRSSFTAQRRVPRPVPSRAR